MALYSSFLACFSPWHCSSLGQLPYTAHRFMKKYDIVIGIEMHIQLAAASKIFCGDSTAFGAAPNTQTSVVSLAHPGVLPVLNEKTLELAARLGFALGSAIDQNSRFDRKNYFYADLPKGYQITQNSFPVCVGGAFTLKLENGSSKTIRIHHAHLEEDAGKSLHHDGLGISQIDLNRAGMALIELVTEPDFSSPEEVSLFMGEMRRLVRWLEIGDGNMEEGSLRFDINISLKPAGSAQLGTRCELKNINSMRFARRAIQFEADRQARILDEGGEIVQETRGFDAISGKTYGLREKEEAHDYRYFPDPDLPPAAIATADIEKWRANQRVLPWVLERQIIDQYGISEPNAAAICQEWEYAQYFKAFAEKAPPEHVPFFANMFVQKILPWASESGKSVDQFPVSQHQLKDLIDLLRANRLTISIAYQRLFPAWIESPGHSALELAESMQLLQSDDSGDLTKWIDAILGENPDKVKAYRQGKKGLIGYFMGELMKKSGGKVSPQEATKLLTKRLDDPGN